MQRKTEKEIKVKIEIEEPIDKTDCTFRDERSIKDKK